MQAVNILTINFWAYLALLIDVSIFHQELAYNIVTSVDGMQEKHYVIIHINDRKSSLKYGLFRDHIFS